MSEQCPQSHLPVSRTRARTRLQRCLFISLMNSLWLNSRDIPIHRLIWGLTRVNSPVFFPASTPNLAEFACPQECTKLKTIDYVCKALSQFLFLPGSFCPALESGSHPSLRAPTGAQRHVFPHSNPVQHSCIQMSTEPARAPSSLSSSLVSCRWHSWCCRLQVIKHPAPNTVPGDNTGTKGLLLHVLMVSQIRAWGCFAAGWGKTCLQWAVLAGKHKKCVWPCPCEDAQVAIPVHPWYLKQLTVSTEGQHVSQTYLFLLML